MVCLDTLGADCVAGSGIVNNFGATTAGFGEIYFAGAGATGAGAETTGAGGITGAGGVTEAGIAAEATCADDIIGEFGKVERTSGPAASFLGIWIPVKILETSFCNPSLLLAIV
jgi:hypothetical protein